jgi:hypothetical protein
MGVENEGQKGQSTEHKCNCSKIYVGHDTNKILNKVVIEEKLRRH